MLSLVEQHDFSLLWVMDTCVTCRFNWPVWQFQAKFGVMPFGLGQGNCNLKLNESEKHFHFYTSYRFGLLFNKRRLLPHHIYLSQSFLLY